MTIVHKNAGLVKTKDLGQNYSINILFWALKYGVLGDPLMY